MGCASTKNVVVHNKQPQIRKCSQKLVKLELSLEASQLYNKRKNNKDNNIRQQ